MAEWFFMFFYRLSLLDKSTAWTVSSILPFYCLMFTRLLNVSSFSFTSTFKFLVVLSSDCDSPTWFAPSNCDPVSECVERTVIQSRHTQTHKKTADFRERCATEFIYTWEMFVLLSVFSAASTVFASRPGNVSPGGGGGSGGGVGGSRYRRRTARAQSANYQNLYSLEWRKGTPSLFTDSKTVSPPFSRTFYGSCKV